MVYEDDGALAQRQDRIGLYLRIGRQHALGQAGDDGLGQREVLHPRHELRVNP